MRLHSVSYQLGVVNKYKYPGGLLKISALMPFVWCLNNRSFLLHQVIYLMENWNSLKTNLFKIYRTRTIQESDSGTVQSISSCCSSLRWVLPGKAYGYKTWSSKHLLTQTPFGTSVSKKSRSHALLKAPVKKKKRQPSSRLEPWKPSLDIDLEETLKGTALLPCLKLECFEYVSEKK